MALVTAPPTRRPSDRVERVARRVQEVLAEALLAHPPGDPRAAGVVVTRTWVSRDLQLVRVYLGSWRTLPSQEEKAAMVRVYTGIAGRLRVALGRELKLRRTPSVAFYWDDALETVRRVDATLAGLVPAAGETVDRSREREGWAVGGADGT